MSDDEKVQENHTKKGGKKNVYTKKTQKFVKIKKENKGKTSYKNSSVMIPRICLKM